MRSTSFSATPRVALFLLLGAAWASCHGAPVEERSQWSASRPSAPSLIELAMATDCSDDPQACRRYAGAEFVGYARECEILAATHPERVPHLAPASAARLEAALRQWNMLGSPAERDALLAPGNPLARQAGFFAKAALDKASFDGSVDAECQRVDLALSQVQVDPQDLSHLLDLTRNLDAWRVFRASR